jgi:hypothetical protein
MVKLVDVIVEYLIQEMLVNALFSVGHNQDSSGYMSEHSRLSGKA